MQKKLANRAESLQKWRTIADKVGQAARRILGDVKVCVFGSAINGELTAASDIDILIVCKRLPKSSLKRARLKKQIEEEAHLPPINPAQIHIATRKEVMATPIYLQALKAGESF